MINREFTERVVEAVKKLEAEKPQERRYEVEAYEKFCQNHVVKHGILFQIPGFNTSKIVYLTHGPYDFEELTFDESARILVNEVEKADSPEDDMLSNFGTFDTITNHIYPMLVNGSQDPEFLDPLLSTDFLDLKVIYFVKMFGESDRSRPFPNLIEPLGHFKIQKSMLNAWGVTEEDILNAARDNMNKAAQTFPMELVLNNLLSGMPDSPDPVTDPVPMYIISTNIGVNGAGAMTDRDVMTGLCEKLDTDMLLVIPSSIHEVIAMDYRNYRSRDENVIDDTNAMIRKVNDEELDPEDVLSNHCYLFHKDKGFINP